jgi:hypothetical protein
MHCDQVFRDWWAERYPTIPLPSDAVIPVLKNLQGHPEVPRLWSARSHGVLIALYFKNTTHDHACITALSMRIFSSSFEWSMISPLDVSLRRHTPSCVTYWTRIGKYLCHDMA